MKPVYMCLERRLTFDPSFSIKYHSLDVHIRSPNEEIKTNPLSMLMYL